MTSFLTPILVGPFFQVSFTCRSGSGGRCTMARPRGWVTEGRHRHI
jgi:hypothetical protein